LSPAASTSGAFTNYRLRTVVVSPDLETLLVQEDLPSETTEQVTVRAVRGILVWGEYDGDDRLLPRDVVFLSLIISVQSP